MWPAFLPDNNPVQAVEVNQAAGIPYCSGQVAIDANGVPDDDDMRSQLIQIISNLEELVSEAACVHIFFGIQWKA